MKNTFSTIVVKISAATIMGAAISGILKAESVGINGNRGHYFIETCLVEIGVACMLGAQAVSNTSWSVRILQLLGVAALALLAFSDLLLHSKSDKYVDIRGLYILLLVFGILLAGIKRESLKDGIANSLLKKGATAGLSSSANLRDSENTG